MVRLFVPGPYREPDEAWTVELVRNNPLAVLVTNGPDDGVPYATHLPIIYDPDVSAGEPAALRGATLLGHMNRANPHWAALRDGMSVLAVFTGAHGYVSPTVYGTNPAAPTWDFTAVHVTAVLRRIASAEQTLNVVRSTVRAFEARFGTGWDMAGSLDYFRRIVPGVGGFRLEVTAAHSMFKLSQEKSPEVFDRVRRSFADSPCPLHHEIAGLMGRLPGQVRRPTGSA